LTLVGLGVVDLAQPTSRAGGGQADIEKVTASRASPVFGPEDRHAAGLAGRSQHAGQGLHRGPVAVVEKPEPVFDVGGGLGQVGGGIVQPAQRRTDGRGLAETDATGEHRVAVGGQHGGGVGLRSHLHHLGV
jgi:hypothetical protein